MLTAVALSPAPSSSARWRLRRSPPARTRVSERPPSRRAAPGQHGGGRGPGRRRAAKRALRWGLGAPSQRVWVKNHDLPALAGSGTVYPKRQNLQGGVTYKGAGQGRRGPSPSARGGGGGFPRPSTLGAPHPRGSPPERPRNCRQRPGGASPALLTRDPRYPGASLCELAARGLRLLGVEVLRLGLLAPRHGEKSAAPGESLRVACLPQPLPGVRKLPPPPAPPAGARMSWQFCSSAERGDLSRTLTADWPGAKTSGVRGKSGPRPCSPQHLRAR